MSEPDAPDNVVALTPWDIAVRGARHRERATALLDRADADRAIQAMSELEAYYLVKGLGPDESVPFLSVLPPAALRTILDLEVWQDGGLSPSDAFVWLEALRQAGLSQLQAAARATDPEVIASLLRRRLFVALKPKDDDPTPDWLNRDDLGPVVETADRRFLIAARTVDELDELGGEDEAIDEDEAKAALQLVDDLYRQEDFEHVAGLLRMAEADLTTAMEEDAKRWRDARMEDLGFPPLERAIEVYAAVDPDAVLEAPLPHAAPDDLRLPALHADRFDRGLFREAMIRLEDGELVRRIESELVALANAVLVADGVDPGNLEGVAESLTRLRDQIELGLSWGTSPSERLEVATRRLADHPPRRLFSVGHGLALRLGSEARQAIAGAPLDRARAPLARLPELGREVVLALKARRPAYAAALDGADAPGRRPLRTPEDVARVRDALSEVAAWGQVARVFGEALDDAEASPPVAERTLEHALCTAWARARLHGAPSLEPLGAAELGAIAQPDPQADAAAIERVLSTLGGAAEGPLARLVARAAARLAEQLAPLGGGRVDPRFVDGVLVSR
jgi:hypothetical protein